MPQIQKCHKFRRQEMIPVRIADISILIKWCLMLHAQTFSLSWQHSHSHPPSASTIPPLSSRFCHKHFSMWLPFSWNLIISDKIFGEYPLLSFTFDIYLGTSWTRPYAGERFAIESVAIPAGCRKDVKRIVGRVECDRQKQSFKYLERKKRMQISSYFKFNFHNEGGLGPKHYFRVFSELHKICVHAKFQSGMTPPSGFFCQYISHFLQIYDGNICPSIF